MARPKKVEEVKTDWRQDLQSRAIENVMEFQRILGRFLNNSKTIHWKKNWDKVWEAFKKGWIIQPRKKESDLVLTLPIKGLAGSVDVNLLLLCENDNHGKIIPAQQTQMTILGSCPCFQMGWLCCWDILRLWAVKCIGLLWNSQALQPLRHLYYRQFLLSNIFSNINSVFWSYKVLTSWVVMLVRCYRYSFGCHWETQSHSDVPDPPTLRIFPPLSHFLKNHSIKKQNVKPHVFLAHFLLQFLRSKWWAHTLELSP